MHKELLNEFVSGATNEVIRRERLHFANRLSDFLETHSFESLFEGKVPVLFLNKSKISKSVFYRMKKSFLDYLTFVYADDEVNYNKHKAYVERIRLNDVVEENNYIEISYQNLDEVLDAIERQIAACKLNFSDAMPMQSLAIFLWYGYSRKEILNVLKSDVKDNRVLVGGGVLHLHDREVQILRGYSKLEYYRHPNGNILSLSSSDKLFRTCRTTDVAEETLSRLVQDTDVLLLKEGKRFNAVILNKCRMFCEVYHLQQHSYEDVGVLLQNQFNTKDTTKIKSLLIEYDRWKQACALK